MYFETIRSDRGCVSYLIGCEKTCSAIVVDPLDDQVDRYLAQTASRGMRIRYLLDTHTHADHFSAVRDLREQTGAPSIMHRSSPAPFVDIHAEDGETIIVGDLRLDLIHTFCNAAGMLGPDCLRFFAQSTVASNTRPCACQRWAAHCSIRIVFHSSRAGTKIRAGRPI